MYFALRLLALRLRPCASSLGSSRWAVWPVLFWVGLSAGCVLALPATSRAQGLTSLYSFSGGADGGNPFAGLIQGADGNLYGTTYFGGVAPGFSGSGTVFKITTGGTLTSLYRFSARSSSGTNSDGAVPYAGLLQGTDGNLYGTTEGGGTIGWGTVFQITTGGAFTSLYSFSAISSSGTNSDGVNPLAGLIQGKDGNLYGTTSSGGTSSSGTVFRITIGGSLTTLYSFSGGADAAVAYAVLIQGKDGNLYGTTSYGGTSGSGTVFKITTGGAFTSLYSFRATSSSGANSDGAVPFAGLLQGTDGNLYGTTSSGGKSGSGAVFKITTGGAFTSLYSFRATSSSGANSDGAAPQAALIQGTDGNLYGTTQEGGTSGYGTVFRITTGGSLTTLYSFSAISSSGTNSDGANPYAALIQGTDGNLYGTTSSGGKSDYGTVFRVSVVSTVPILTGLSPSSTNANGPAFTLKVTGSAFQSTSTVNWNGSALTTTFVSATQLKAAVPASLLAKPANAKVTVVTPSPGGGTSAAKTFTILTTTLNLKTAKVTRNTSKNTLTAVVSLANTGFLSAKSTTVKQATLNATSATNLPQSAGSIAAGSTKTVTLVFPGSAGSSGAKVTLKVSGTFTGGTFNATLKVTLP